MYCILLSELSYSIIPLSYNSIYFLFCPIPCICLAIFKLMALVPSIGSRHRPNP